MKASLKAKGNWAVARVVRKPRIGRVEKCIFKVLLVVLSFLLVFFCLNGE